MKDEQWNVSFFPQHQGQHTISVTVADQHILREPLGLLSKIFPTVHSNVMLRNGWIIPHSIPNVRLLLDFLLLGDVQWMEKEIFTLEMVELVNM